MPISGNGGNVTADGADILDVRNFSVNRVSDNKPYNSSDTAGQTKRVAGNKDWTVSIGCYLDAGELDLGFDEGDTVAFVGITIAGKQISGNILIDSIEAEVDIEGGELEGCVINGGGHGVYEIT